MVPEIKMTQRWIKRLLISPLKTDKLNLKDRADLDRSKCKSRSSVRWTCQPAVLVEWLLWQHIWLWKLSFDGLLTEWHWLMIPIICRSSVAIASAFRRRETLPSRQLRMFPVYAVEFHSWWLRQKHTQTDTHMHAWYTCGGPFFLCVSLSDTHINTDTDSNQPSASLSSSNLHKIFIYSWFCLGVNEGANPKSCGYQNNI